MAQMQDGQTAALGIFFCRYHRLVFDVAKRILRDRGEAEDILQDVFIEVFKKASLYDPDKGSVKTWLLQYAYHRSFNRRKYLALRSFYNSSPAAALVDLEMAAGGARCDAMTVRDWQQLLSHGFRELNPKERQIIELIAFEGLTVREASRQMRDTYVNGRNYYYRALKKLRRFFATGNPNSRLEVKDDVHS